MRTQRWVHLFHPSPCTPARRVLRPAKRPLIDSRREHRPRRSVVNLLPLLTSQTATALKPPGLQRGHRFRNALRAGGVMRTVNAEACVASPPSDHRPFCMTGRRSRCQDVRARGRTVGDTLVSRSPPAERSGIRSGRTVHAWIGVRLTPQLTFVHDEPNATPRHPGLGLPKDLQGDRRCGRRIVRGLRRRDLRINRA